MVKAANERPTSSSMVEVKGLPEGARSQPGHHGPWNVTMNRARMGRKALDPHKPENLSACSSVIFFQITEELPPGEGSYFESRKRSETNRWPVRRRNDGCSR